MKLSIAVVAVLTLACGTEGPIGLDSSNDPRNDPSCEEWQSFVRELDPMWEPTPFELGMSAYPYDGDGGSGSGSSWTQYAPPCDPYWPAASASCAPTPDSFRSYTGVITGSMCLMSAAVLHCDAPNPLKLFADTAVKTSFVAYVYVHTVWHINDKWLNGEI